MNNTQLALHFFLQLAVVLLVCRVMGSLVARVGQPRAMAEMLAGILLGPSLFGLVLPEWQAWLFPWDKAQGTRDTQSYLYPIAQLGLALYMFIVGLEFRVETVRKHARAALAVSIAGIVAPFILGAALAWACFDTTPFFPKFTTVGQAMLFLGASMCITAFPVMARIIEAKGIGHTIAGSVAIGAGAINDAAAWCLLAFVLSSADGDMRRTWLASGGGVGFVMVMFLVVKPLLARHRAWFMEAGDKLGERGMTLALVLLALAAWSTEFIGLHAVFGAFILGMVMPRGAICRDLRARIQPLTVGLLLPLFFTYSGLNTKLSLLDTPYLWFMALAVLAAAVLGKGVACWLAARAFGIGNREAASIGALMNARGLMELIIINIGLQRGIISEELFAALALMAVVTTLMTVPMFDWAMRQAKAMPLA